MDKALMPGVFGNNACYCVSKIKEETQVKGLFANRGTSIKDLVESHLNSSENLDFTNYKKIGRGCGSIQVVSARLTDRQGNIRHVACKITKQNKFTINEVLALAKLKDKDNIVQLLGVCIIEEDKLNKCFLVLELADANLFKYIVELGKLSRAIPMNEIASIIKDMCSAISYCEISNINHEDIHLLNWLMFYGKGETTAKVKLADFGVSSNLGDNTNTMMRDTLLNLDHVIASNSHKSNFPGCTYIYESVEQLANKNFKTKYRRLALLNDETDFNIYLSIYVAELTKYLNGCKELATILTPLLIIYSHMPDDNFTSIKIPSAAEIVTAIAEKCDPQPFRALPVEA